MFCTDASWGPRQCLGDKFSLLEQRTLLLKLLSCFELRPTHSKTFTCSTCMSQALLAYCCWLRAVDFENVLGMLWTASAVRLLTQFQAWREVWNNYQRQLRQPSIGLTRWRHGDAGGYILQICNQLDAPAARGQALVTTVDTCCFALCDLLGLVGFWCGI